MLSQASASILINLVKVNDKCAEQLFFNKLKFDVSEILTMHFTKYVHLNGEIAL